MPIDEENSTFEFCRDWLVSSDTFVRVAMGVDVLDLDGARDAARARIHDEEAYDVPDEAEANETAPDLPPSVNCRPRAIVATEADRRRVVGTGTIGGDGELLITVEVLLPEAYVINGDDTAQAAAAKFKAGRQWMRRLCKTIRNELLETRGSHDGDGAPYLNARDVDIEAQTAFPVDSEDDPNSWIGWIYRVPWN
jgi:hypothetical protein